MERPAVEGERRPITALFADIVGSTSIAEAMDPEEWADLISGATAEMRRIVERYEGTVKQVLGDGILAYFGTPVAHEDDPQRAVRAALDLTSEIPLVSRRLAETPLRVRVGVATGTVVVRDDAGAPGRRDTTALGDAVNVAARLQAEAEPNSALVTAETYAFVRGLVEAMPAGRLSLKGRAEPVEAYRIVAWTGSRVRPRGIAGLSSPMVGRDAELSRLEGALAVVRSGRGRAAAVVGEPGIGKSRLLAELRGRAGAGEPTVAWHEGRCVTYGQNLPHHLVLDLLRSLLGVSEDDPDALPAVGAGLRRLLGDEAADMQPYVAHVLSLDLDPGARAEIARLSPDALQGRYVAALRALIAAAAARGPIVLACEDVHWADEASVGLLTQLMAIVDELPVLLLVVSRPDRHAPGWRLVTEARDRFGDALTELRVTRLSEDDSRRLVANLLEIESLPASTRDAILDRSEGNPFFVEEIVRMLIDRGAIVRQRDRWVATDEVQGITIPDTIHGLLLARIDRLPAESRQALRVAAVIGRRFSASVLERVMVRR